MKKILYFFWIFLISNLVIGSPYISLRIGRTFDPVPGIIQVPITCGYIINPIDHLVSSWNWYIAYHSNVLYAGEVGSSATLVNYHPEFPEENYSTLIIADNPLPGWNTILISFSTSNPGEINANEKFFDIEFYYTPGFTEIPNVNWTSLNGNESNMVDGAGNSFILHLSDGYAGPHNILPLQPTATLKIGFINEAIPGYILVPVTLEAVNNSLIFWNSISSFGWYIAYDTEVLYAGDPSSPATLLNFHPSFPPSNYLTNIIADNPLPGWNTVAIICSPCLNEVFPGIKFFDIQFNYNEVFTAYPNIKWTSSPQGFETNLADDEGNEFFLTLIDGYAGPFIELPTPAAALKIGTIYDPQPGSLQVPVTCEAFENSLTGNNIITTLNWQIAYDTHVLYAGEPGSSAILTNFNPSFSGSCFYSIIRENEPFPDWNTINILKPCGCQGTINQGEKFFDISFTYNEGLTEEPNILWTGYSESFKDYETFMRDGNGNEFELTFMDGYVGPYPFSLNEVEVDPIKVWQYDRKIFIETEWKGEMALFTLTGQLLVSTTLQKGLNVIPADFDNSIYFLRIVTKHLVSNQKIYIP
jgi:hypothetical protein